MSRGKESKCVKKCCPAEYRASCGCSHAQSPALAGFLKPSLRDCRRLMPLMGSSACALASRVSRGSTRCGHLDSLSLLKLSVSEVRISPPAAAPPCAVPTEDCDIAPGASKAAFTRSSHSCWVRKPGMLKMGGSTLRRQRPGVARSTSTKLFFRKYSSLCWSSGLCSAHTSPPAATISGGSRMKSGACCSSSLCCCCCCCCCC
mmetsp:Transcript_3531/g.10170  ORF Transcript_3531/g.10170 Transcript_3531/m.10170 type:complete len:203 (-) Transcript_3531:274-882(-)